VIGMFRGTVTGRSHQNTGFVVLYRELRSHLRHFNGSEWLVLTALVLDADENGFCCPSVARIAGVTGLCEKSVRSAINGLCTVNLRGFPVLQVEKRHDRKRRATSNAYRILPEGFPDIEPGSEVPEPDWSACDEPEDGNFYQDEESVPVNFGGVTSLKYKDNSIDTVPPIVPPDPVNFTEPDTAKPKRQSRKRDSVKMPSETDPARGLFVAYRQVLYGPAVADAFTLGEWRGAHHVLRSMQASGVTPDQVENGTRFLARKWRDKNMVTINALWKHWTASQATPDALEATRDLVERSGEIFDMVVGWQDS